MIESRAEWEREESKGERERWGGGGKREGGWEEGGKSKEIVIGAEGRETQK